MDDCTQRSYGMATGFQHLQDDVDAFYSSWKVVRKKKVQPKDMFQESLKTGELEGELSQYVCSFREVVEMLTYLQAETRGSSLIDV